MKTTNQDLGKQAGGQNENPAGVKAHRSDDQGRNNPRKDENIQQQRGGQQSGQQAGQRRNQSED